MIEENEEVREKARREEAKDEAKGQAEGLFEMIKDKAYELCVDLDWYTDEVLEQINKAREDSE